SPSNSCAESIAPSTIGTPSASNADPRWGRGQEGNRRPKAFRIEPVVEIHVGVCSGTRRLAFLTFPRKPLTSLIGAMRLRLRRLQRELLRLELSLPPRGSAPRLHPTGGAGVPNLEKGVDILYGQTYNMRKQRL